VAKDAHESKFVVEEKDGYSTLLVSFLVLQSFRTNAVSQDKCVGQ
jgi:hypothetical protein